MRVVVSVETRFERTPDGAVWTHGPFSYRFWARYLDVFSEASVVARLRDVPAPGNGAVRADGPGVTFASVPYYTGPWQYLVRAAKVQRAAARVVKIGDAVILRVGSQIGNCIETRLRRWQYPYGLEVVTDPYDVFAPGAVAHPLRPFFRWWFPRRLRRQCGRAVAVAYVTNSALQRRYPSSRDAFTTHYSSVELPEEAFVRGPRPRVIKSGTKHLIFVGSMSQLYKAPDVLIDAVAKCIGKGVELRLTLVGDGRHREELQKRAARLGIADRVRFLGHVPAGEAVRRELDAADLFVLPSRSEGLPRAMIEAMARGLPCIGSTVGGIPELLSAEDLVPPGDVGALADRIGEVASDPDRLARMSARNLAKAREYREEVLRVRRIEFYEYVRKMTRAWSAKRLA